MSEEIGIVVFGRALTARACFESGRAATDDGHAQLADRVGPIPARLAWAISTQGGSGEETDEDDEALGELARQLSARCGRACLWSYQEGHEYGQHLILFEDGRQVHVDQHHPGEVEDEHALPFREWPLSRLARSLGLELPDQDLEEASVGDFGICLSDPEHAGRFEIVVPDSTDFPYDDEDLSETSEAMERLAASWGPDVPEADWDSLLDD
jgi:hypothetical protein